jgi:hypothetical protein
VIFPATFLTILFSTVMFRAAFSIAVLSTVMFSTPTSFKRRVQVDGGRDVHVAALCE